MRVMSSALLPWKTYLDALPESERAVMIWDLRKVYGDLVDIAVPGERQTLKQRRITHA